MSEPVDHFAEFARCMDRLSRDDPREMYRLAGDNPFRRLEAISACLRAGVSLPESEPDSVVAPPAVVDSVWSGARVVKGGKRKWSRDTDPSELPALRVVTTQTKAKPKRGRVAAR